MDPVSLLIELFSLIFTIVGVFIAWRQWRESRLKKTPVPEISVALHDGIDGIASELLVSVFTAPPSAGNLFGRESQINSLSQDISTHRLNNLVIEGIEGIGKTALAAAIAEQLGSVLWVNCSGEEITFESFVLSVISLALREGKEFSKPVFFSPNQSKSAKTREVIRILSSGEYRIIFDDFHFVEDQSLKTLLIAIIDQCQKIALVFTTRIHLDFMEDLTFRILPRFVELEALDLDSANHYLRYLGEVYPQLNSANDETLKSIWLYAGMGHPLALKIFAALTRYSSIPDLLSQLGQYHDKLGEWIGKLFKDLSKDEVSVLCCLSLFRVPVSEQAIFHVLGKKGSQESINAVINRFLIERDSMGELYLHAVLRDYMHNLLSPEQAQLYHQLAGDYFEVLKMTNSTTLRYGLEAYYHYQQSHDKESVVRVFRKLKNPLFDAGQFDRLSELLRDVEPYIYQSIAEETVKRSPILFLGGGEVAHGIAKALDQEQYVTIVIDRRLSVASRDTDFQILLGEEGFRNTDRIITILRKIGEAINSSSNARFPCIITDYYGFDAEKVFGAAESLGYRIFPNKEAAIVACDKVAFWQHFGQIPQIASALIPRTWIEIPEAVSQHLKKELRSPLVDNFVDQVKNEILHIGFPCVLKLAITELGYGQSIIQGGDESKIYDALCFAIKQAHEHGINPRDRIILEKEISQPFSEVVQIAVRHHDPINGLRITFAPPILVRHISKKSLASNDPSKAVTGPFVLDNAIQCDIRQMPSQVHTNLSRIQTLTSNMIDSLGASPGIFGVTFFITDSELWIPDDFPAKAEDTMFVTKAAQLYGAADILAMCLADKPIQASIIQELQFAGGTRTILWREDRLAELENIKGQVEASKVQGVYSVEIFDSKIDLRPLRLMGMIFARLPKNASLQEIENCLDEASLKLKIVPRSGNGSII